MADPEDEIFSRLDDAHPDRFGGLLRVLREARGLASDEFARRVGVRPEVITQFETGQLRTKPPPEQLRLFATVLASTPVRDRSVAPQPPAPANAAQPATATTSGSADAAPPKSPWEKLQGFWTTLPEVLKALAVLIGAITPLVAGLYAAGLFGRDGPPATVIPIPALMATATPTATPTNMPTPTTIATSAPTSAPMPAVIATTTPTPAAASPNDVPSMPTGVSAKFVRGNATVTWNVAEVDERITSYEIYRNEKSIGTTRSFETSYIDVLPCEGVYRYRVVAIDAAGNRSAPSQATEPILYLCSGAPPGQVLP